MYYTMNEIMISINNLIKDFPTKHEKYLKEFEDTRKDLNIWIDDNLPKYIEKNFNYITSINGKMDLSVFVVNLDDECSKRREVLRKKYTVRSPIEFFKLIELQKIFLDFLRQFNKDIKRSLNGDFIYQIMEQK